MTTDPTEPAGPLNRPTNTARDCAGWSWGWYEKFKRRSDVPAWVTSPNTKVNR